MLELRHIFKKIDDRVLIHDLHITFPDCGFIGIQGESGCGKSSLLYILGLLDHDFEGDIYFNGECVTQSTSFNQEHIAYMMQNKDYIDALTVKENIVLASQIASLSIDEKHLQHITSLLEIEQLLNRYPSQLSGGQLKRMSIAKALLKNASIILCDEPTGALHQKQAQEVMCLLKEVSQQRLVIIVSHDPKLLNDYCDSVLTMQDGTLLGEMITSSYKQHDVKKQYHFLWFYPLKQLLYQKHKIIFLLIFQWILMVASFLMMTGMNGFLEVIKDDQYHSVMSNITFIEHKNHEPFNEIIMLKSCLVDYDYRLHQLQTVDKLSAQYQLLPYNTSHIELKEGRLPLNNQEVIISASLAYHIDDLLQFKYGEEIIEMRIVGILKPSMFHENKVYFPLSFKERVPLLKDDYVLKVESSLSQHKLYKSLSKDYIAYHEVLERVQSYQTLLEMARIVFYVFLGISLVISLLLIRIVLNILYYERQHDVAYLMSLGLSRRRFKIMTLMESLCLAFAMTIGGSGLCALVFYYINDVICIEQFYYIQLVLKPIFFGTYDLYIVMGCLYVLICIIACLKPMKEMMHCHVIDILREE